MRVHLFAPSDPAKLEAATASGADALWFEGSNGVDTLRAAAGRQTAEFYVRFFRDDDLDRAMTVAPNGVIAPARDGADVQNLGVKLAVREAESGLADGATRIVALIDAPGAVLRLDSFAGASKRLAALAFDAQTFATAAGIADLNAAPIGLARNLTLLAAKAAGVAAILVDATHSSDDYKTAKRDGFDAIVVRDPANVANVRALLK